MHSSRMRTARSSPYRGNLCPGGPCPGGLCPGGLCQGGGVSVQGVVSVQGGSVRETPSPVYRMRDTCCEILPCSKLRLQAVIMSAVLNGHIHS